MIVYCFGNEFLEYDSLAKQIADEIKIEGIELLKCDSLEEIFESKGDIVILDVVDKIDKVIEIDDVEKLDNEMVGSLHDFDLGFFLKLMKKMDQIKEVKIIGIPMKGDKVAIKKEIESKLTACLTNA